MAVAAAGTAKPPITAAENIEAWLSLVERYIRDVEVASSNLVASMVRNVGNPTFFFCVEKTT